MLPVVSRVSQIRPLSPRTIHKKNRKSNDFSSIFHEELTSHQSQVSKGFIEAEWEEIFDHEDTLLNREAPWYLYKKTQNILCYYRHQINFYT